MIWRLHITKCYGNKHTSIEHLKQGVKDNQGGQIKSAIDDLIQWQLISLQGKTKEKHVSLNMNRVKLIHLVVDWFANNPHLIDKKNMTKCYFRMDV